MTRKTIDGEKVVEMTKVPIESIGGHVYLAKTESGAEYARLDGDPKWAKITDSKGVTKISW
jgi:hypothetical protein